MALLCSLSLGGVVVLGSCLFSLCLGLALRCRSWCRRRAVATVPCGCPSGGRCAGLRRGCPLFCSPGRRSARAGGALGGGLRLGALLSLPLSAWVLRSGGLGSGRVSSHRRRGGGFRLSPWRGLALRVRSEGYRSTMAAGLLPSRSARGGSPSLGFMAGAMSRSPVSPVPLGRPISMSWARGCISSIKRLASFGSWRNPLDTN